MFNGQSPIKSVLSSLLSLFAVLLGPLGAVIAILQKIISGIFLAVTLKQLFDAFRRAPRPFDGDIRRGVVRPAH
ncbi:hypothetical protein AB0216_26830, partial [Klebsiella pneumoniae]